LSLLSSQITNIEPVGRAYKEKACVGQLVYKFLYIL